RNLFKSLRPKGFRNLWGLETRPRLITHGLKVMASIYFQKPNPPPKRKIRPIKNPRTMIRAEELVKCHVSYCKSQLYIEYLPQTSRTVFDVCDENGRIIKTGSINDFETKIEITDLANSKYVLLILDGDRVNSQNFTVSR